MTSIVRTLSTAILALTFALLLPACGEKSQSDAPTGDTHTHEDGSTHSHDGGAHMHSDTSETRLDTSGMDADSANAMHDEDHTDNHDHGHDHGDGDHTHN